MRNIILQIIFIGGIIYGIVSLFKTLQKPEIDRYQLSLSMTLIIFSTVSLWINLQ